MNKLDQNVLERYAEGNENKQYIKDSYQNLKELLEKFKFHNKSIKVFLQGSYKNDTDINFDSDIDIVVYYEEMFNENVRHQNDNNEFHKETNLTPTDVDKFNQHFSNSEYTQQEYKQAIKTWIESNSNDYVVTNGDKTLKCKIKNSKYNFDIVCAIQYRLYTNFDNPDKFDYGNFLRGVEGERVINFPKQTYKNSMEKNKNTGKYKETVRIIKNIMKRNYDKNLWIPSFALESILYNVSDKSYNIDTKHERVKTVIEEALSLVNNNWSSLLEPNKILYVKNIKRVDQNKVLNILNLMNSML